VTKYVVVRPSLDGTRFSVYRLKSESESECKCLTYNQKPTGSQFSLLHEPN